MIFTFGVIDLKPIFKKSTMIQNLKNAKLWTLDAVHANIKTKQTEPITYSFYSIVMFQLLKK